ncbi:phage major capsid protein [Luteolibacter sp. Populi]|uniref:phage major capsid protein n=1 Tax=Luteolibacter sp. Populi TaxID=3230487 RepID=UPI003466C8F4
MKIFALTSAVFLLPFAVRAQDDGTARLREALKDVTLQLRTAQGETATAQAAAIAAEQKTKGLETKLADLEKRNAALAKQSNDDKAASEKTIAGLNNRLAEREKRLVEYIAALDKWKAGYEALAGAARAKEAEGAKFADEAIALKRTVADRERKNIALFNLSTEILDRYEGYALGKSLVAKEPFIGTARVQAENLVQGYRGKILDNRLNAPATKP